ncbi:MAG TPA: phosphatidic acid phosphatase [Dehalococcoidia bacterium]|jgi:membrane-associated phospholipid phosphatase|nr:phosphatidic acid phosphatase [Dehalococcoidia bacterium]
MRKQQLASLMSNILNPYLVSLVVIVLLALKSTPSTGDAIKWSLILVAITILPVFSVIAYLAHKEKLDGIFISVREQRNKLYLLASVCTVASCLVLLYFGAPLVLVATIVAALSAAIIFMGINFLWKISLHTAFAAGSVTALTIVYGAIGALSVMLVPPVAWSRIELEQHSPAQAVAGAFLAALIVVVVFHFFGLVGSSAPL